MATKNLDIILNDLNTVKNNYCKEDINMLKFLQMVNKKKTLSPNDKPTDLRVSTQSAKCCLSHKIDTFYRYSMDY